MNTTSTTNPVFFAGGMYETGNPADPVEFRMVHASGNDRPYLTKRFDGLRTTAGHASLYMLAPDGKTARLVDRRYDLDGKNPDAITLTVKERNLVEKAVRDRYYFD